LCEFTACLVLLRALALLMIANGIIAACPFFSISSCLIALRRKFILNLITLSPAALCYSLTEAEKKAPSILVS
jgi:hypothetical protein